MRRWLPLLLLVFALPSLTGGAANARYGQATRDFMTTSFSTVSIDGPISVTINTNANPTIIAKGDADMVDRLLVRKSGDRLQISLRRTSTDIDRDAQQGGQLHVDISSWQIERLNISGPADVSIDALMGQKVSLAIAGSGSLSVNKSMSDLLEIGMTGTGILSIAEGEADDTRIDMDGAPSISAVGLRTDRLKLSKVGPGTIDITVRDTADIISSGSGAITVTGTSACDVKSAGSAAIICNR